MIINNLLDNIFKCRVCICQLEEHIIYPGKINVNCGIARNRQIPCLARVMGIGNRKAQ